VQRGAIVLVLSLGFACSRARESGDGHEGGLPLETELTLNSLPASGEIEELELTSSPPDSQPSRSTFLQAWSTATLVSPTDPKVTGWRLLSVALGHVQGTFREVVVPGLPRWSGESDQSPGRVRDLLLDAKLLARPGDGSAR
jgi:hypothetical protein